MVNLTSNIKDTTGKFLVGSAGMYFYISPTSVTDTVQPTVAGIAPSNTSTNIGDNALIQLSFSKPIDPLTINSSTVNVSGGAYTVTPASVAYDSTNQNLAITRLWLRCRITLRLPFRSRTLLTRKAISWFPSAQHLLPARDRM